MIDIHAHLHDSAFDLDRDEVVRRARDAGVTEIITIGTDILESRKAVVCAEKYEGVYVSVGIHPHFFNEVIEKEFPISNFQFLPPHRDPAKAAAINSQFLNSKIQKEIEELRELAGHAKVVAIGECGLDYYVRSEQGTVNSEQKKTQKEGFLAQIELARELHLPLVIHCRPSVGTMDAYEDLFLILSNLISSIQYPAFILHCYMGDTEVTKKFLSLPNIYFSFTGNITYPVKKMLAGTRDDLTETVKIIPIDRLLAETDCPYLAPVPYRGKRNEPAFVVEVVRKIAEIKGISDEEVRRTVTASAKTIFEI